MHARSAAGSASGSASGSAAGRCARAAESQGERGTRWDEEGRKGGERFFKKTQEIKGLGGKEKGLEKWREEEEAKEEPKKAKEGVRKLNPQETPK